MLGLFEVVSGIGELLSAWRLYLSLAITAGIIWLIFLLVSSESARLAICIPVALLGFGAGLYWEIKSNIK